MYNEGKGHCEMKASAGLPPVLCFPYVDLDPRVLKGLLCLFQGVHLLQPTFSVSGFFTERCEAAGWVGIHKPLRLDLDAAGARRLIREFERLAALHQDSGYLSYLKHGGGQWLEEARGSAILREIRHYGQCPSPPDELEPLRGQLLLQLAQELDRQRREIQEALEEVSEREKSLLVGLGLGQEDAGDMEWEMEPLPNPEEDEFLIPQRLGAWGEMLGALSEAPRPFLLTENRCAMEELLERAMAAAEKGMPEPVGILQVTLPCFSPVDVEELGRIREALGGLLPWKIFCERLGELLRSARGEVWTERSIGETLAKARALASYLQESVGDSLLESVVRLEPSWDEGWREWVLEIVLFPGWKEEVLLRGGGITHEDGSHPNALILYLREGGRPGVDLHPGRGSAQGRSPS